MPISFVAAGAVATGTNPSVAVPAGYQQADLLVLTVAVAAAVEPTTPTGWTLLGSQTTTPRIYIYRKFATGSESSVALTCNSTTTAAAMVAYRGVSATDTISTFATATSTTVATNTLTTTYANEYVVSIYAMTTGADTWTAPASTTSRVNSAGTAALAGLLIVDESQAAAGTSTARTATSSASKALAAGSFSIIPSGRYWVGGGAYGWENSLGWSFSSGGAGGAPVPTAQDDVFFDQGSGYTVLMNAITECLSWTSTVPTIEFRHGNAGVRNDIYGSLTVSAGTLWTQIVGMRFLSTSSGRTIQLNGSSLGSSAYSNMIFNGVGGGWTLGGNTTFYGITCTAGTLSTSASNYTLTTSLGVLINGGTLTLNGSTVNVGTNFQYSSGTINAGTSTIALLSANATFSGGGQTYNTVSFTNTAISSVVVNGANTFSTLSFAARAASGLGYVSFSANQTINTSFTAQSGATDPSRRIFLRSNTFGTVRTITSASNNIFGADFADITAAGAASWTDSTRTNYWGDAKGNTGITFAAGRTVYWNLGGTSQNWNATAWALTSTGTPNANNFPLAQDTAVFTNLGSVPSGSVDVTTFNLGTIDMSARTSAMTLFNPGSFAGIFGDWITGTGITYTGGGGELLFIGRNTQNLTSAGKAFPNTRLSISSIGGTLNLVDAFTSAADIILGVGAFNTQNNNITVVSLDHNGSAFTLTLGSSTVTLTGAGGILPWRLQANATLNAGTSNIVLSNTSTTARSFAGGGYTYNKLTIGGATGTSITSITGVNTFAELASTKTVAHSIQFAANQTIGTWSVTGSAGNLVSLFSNNINAQRTLTITNRTSGIDYLSIERIAANKTPVTFFAGANSRLGQWVAGIAAIAPLPANEFLYVLDTGTSWTVPANFNSLNNSIHLISGGGGGSGARVSGANRAGGGGGGGGGYTKALNVALTPAASISYAVGSGGSGGGGGLNGGAGGNTTFNSGALTTTGGGGGQASLSPLSSTGGTAGTGSTFNGGVGGVGSFSSLSEAHGGGGGGGAAGLNGAGGNGGNGFGSVTDNLEATGGGGGNGGGSNGGNATSGAGGAGGNNFNGVGGSPNRLTAAFNGGGGSGSLSYRSFQAGAAASCGVDIYGVGGGGGSGRNDLSQQLYGGAGPGGGVDISGFAYGGGNGAQGGIIIWYQTAPASNGNFFFLFG